MFIKKLQIKNFRLFPSDKFIDIDNISVPNAKDDGSGLTIVVGENGCGKSTILDSFALPYVSYKADSFSVDDVNNLKQKVEINIYLDENFTFKGTIPKTEYKGKGFSFIGGIRSKSSNSYLSSIIVTDQKYIRADGETKPLDNSPDLRLSVNNPWSGTRFNELDFLILDRNRIFQTRKGTYNDTRFDRIMDDLNYRYLLKDENPIDCNEKLKEVKNVGNKGVITELSEALDKFSEISGNAVRLKLIDNLKPFSNAFFAVDKENNQSISISQLGSGYEMIFALIYSYYLSKKNNKKLIILIDEPELHLHPKLQSDFINLLLEFSIDSQIILSTHSPLFIKQAMVSANVEIKIINKDNAEVKIVNPENCALSYPSSNEINFIAFNLATEEYHNELYEQLHLNNGGDKIKKFDNEFFIKEKGELKNSPWMGYPNEVSIHTFIRNQIHHRSENGIAEYEQLKNSITTLRTYLLESKNATVNF